VIFFRYVDASTPREVMEIIHILHGARDIEAFFHRNYGDGLTGVSDVCIGYSAAIFRLSCIARSRGWRCILPSFMIIEKTLRAHQHRLGPEAGLPSTSRMSASAPSLITPSSPLCPIKSPPTAVAHFSACAGV